MMHFVPSSTFARHRLTPLATLKCILCRAERRTVGPYWVVLALGMSGLFFWLPNQLASALEPDPPHAIASASGTPHPGLNVYRNHCQRCHGENGGGTKVFAKPLIGDRSISHLAALIDETMPEDDPSLVTGLAAQQVAEYIHGAFYSAIAQDRNRPARLELSRLTVRQYQNTVADIVGSFGRRDPGIPAGRGLRGEYFRGRDFNTLSRVLEQIDPQVSFDFRSEGPDPERFEPNRFAIRWTGSIVPPETGTYEFIVRTEHAVKLFVNTASYASPLVDAWVQSGDSREHRGFIFLLGGRLYPLRLDFSKANQGIDNTRHEHLTQASIELLWKPPQGVLEIVPQQCLSPVESPPTFVVQTPFPPDDRSIGYDRGSSVSSEWFAATTAAGTETADGVVKQIEHLAHVKRDAANRAEGLQNFAATFAARAFRRPLSDDLRQLVVDRHFATAPDIDTALFRSLLAVLGSPRFLFCEPDSRQNRSTSAESALKISAFETASRLSFGLWDSIPDEPLWQAAEQNQLATPEQVAGQAERMVNDRRTRTKVRDFLMAWLRVDHNPEILKDKSLFVTFSPQIAADMRRSLELFLDDIVWGPGSDFRRLFSDDEVYLNGRLASLYDVALPADAPFQRIRLDDGKRAGLLSHPYMMSVLSYAGSTSPIHRGVFLARSVLGNVLRPPQEAVSPLAPELHPDLTTRQRVALQTSAVACQTCHTLINPLGFALEEFDGIGRYRRTEQKGGLEKPIEPSGSYQPRAGGIATFSGARELAASLANSRDAQEAFVQSLFHALAKQPVRAWGPETLESLRQSFASHDYNIRHLLVAIMTVAATPPGPASQGAEQAAIELILQPSLAGPLP
ncbi:MAG: DUF1592 domain-containing protein [Planctomycetota bacterium]